MPPTALWTVNDGGQCPPASPGCTESQGNVQFFGVIADDTFDTVVLLNTGVRFDTEFGDTFNDVTHLDRMVSVSCLSSDADGDGVADPPGGCGLAIDNCPFAPNPLQEDADSDGTGDACTCGDLTGDGTATGSPGGDAERIQDARLGLGPPLTSEETDRCAVHPDSAACGLVHAVVLQRDEALLGPGVEPSCVAATPLPVHLWRFDLDASDAVGPAHGTPFNGATVAGGALLLDGIDDYVRTDPTDLTLDEKTLVTWAALDNLTQQGGGTLTVQDPTGTDVFDAVVFGEQLSGQWMNGSDFLARTPPGDNGGVLETLTEPDLVMLAASYVSDGEVVLRRNGVDYARHSTGTPVSFAAGVSDFVLGLRHEDAASQTGTATGSDAYLAGHIEEARVYAAPLSAAQVAAMAAAGPSPFDPHLAGPLVLWLDASDLSTLSLGGGQVVTEWRDKSSAVNHHTPSSASAEPVLLAGSPGMVEFDGGDHPLCGAVPINLTSGGTIFVVGRNDVRKNYQGLFSLRSSTGIHAILEFYWQAGTTNAGSGNVVLNVNREVPAPTSFYLHVDALPAVGNDYVASATLTSIGSPGVLSMNGVVQSITSSSGSQFLPDAARPPCVGLGFGNTPAGNALDGRIGEVLVYPLALSAVERAGIEAYLMRKWGIN